MAASARAVGRPRDAPGTPTPRSAKALSWRRWRCFIFLALAVAGCLAAALLLMRRHLAHLGQLAPQSGRRVALLMLGDFGDCAVHLGTSTPYRAPKAKERQACENQTRLVPAMAAVASGISAQLVLNLGDAFYDQGLFTAEDDGFRLSFSDVYDRGRYPSLDIPWHGIMGNHEYESPNISCHFDPRLKERDPRWHAYLEGSLQLPDAENPLVEVLLFDATPFAEKYLNQAGGKLGDKKVHSFSEQRKRGATPGQPTTWQRELQGQLERLERRLASARQRGVPWIVVAGHNPIRSDGDHGDEVSLVALLDPLLWEYGVAAYFNGHDHNIEHQMWTRCCEFRSAPPTAAGGPVVLNEALDDDRGEYVELYNAGDEPVSLAGWRLQTDSIYRELQLPDKLLEPRAFLRVDKKLKDGSDAVRLLDATGSVVSELAWGFGHMRNGLAVGRFPDGADTPVLAMAPTGGAPNAPPQPRGRWLPAGAPAATNLSGWLPAADPRFAARRPGVQGQRLHYFTVGGGGGLGKHPKKAASTLGEFGGSVFYRRQNGFLAVEATEAELSLKFVGADGGVLHEVAIPAGGRGSVVRP